MDLEEQKTNEGSPDGSEPSAGGCHVGEPDLATYVPKHQTLTELFGSPEAAPLGTACVFPQWQDKHHPRQVAIRYAAPGNLCEPHPWVLLDSDGPQVLDNESVINCEWLPFEELARELKHPEGAKYIEVRPQTCESSRHIDGLGTVRCGIYLGHTGEHRGGAQGRRFMWLPEGVEWHE